MAMTRRFARAYRAIQFVSQGTALGLFCGTAIAQVITPAEPIVRAGQSLRFKADRAVSWSLMPGSAGTIDPDGTYHAPASVKAPASMGGCQIGAPDSIFNTRIDTLPVHPNNAKWMAALPPQGIGFEPSWGINVGDNHTPSKTLNFAYTTTYNDKPFQIPEWPNLKRENGIFSDPLTNVDRHVLTVNRDTCNVYEIYNNYPAGTMGKEAPANSYTAQSGWQYNSMSYTLPTAGASDAAGLPLAPTTLSLDDIRSGAIRHAIRVTFGNAYIARNFVWPATSNAGAWGAVPYGTRFRLKASLDITPFSPVAKMILTALKQYGMIISDGGSNWSIITATDLTEDRAVDAALREIWTRKDLVKSSEFEIVDESSLMISAASSRIAYKNPYVAPPAYAIVKADDGKHPPVTTGIALQGVALNSPDAGGVWIQSGIAKTLKVFTGGTSNPAVTWTMKPPLGSLGAATGLYTAPAVNAPTTISVTATSVVDTKASVTFPLTVLPPGPIRIAAGDATANPAAPHSHAPDFGPDSKGNMWWRDQGAERAGGVKNDYWSGGQWAKGPDVFLYQTQWYNFGDTIYRFVVPNGNYKIDYYVAQGDCGAGNTRNPMWYREHLEAQGQIAAHDYRPLEAVDSKCYTPIHAVLPAQVTDNDLYFALRRITDHTQAGTAAQPVTIISAFSITPSGDSPHLTIDPPSVPPLTISQTRQFYSVGWYMSNKVTWTLESGPGSIDANGLYAAPSKPVNGTAVIKAISKSDPSQTATITVPLAFGNMSLSAPSAGPISRGQTRQFKAVIGGHNYANVSWSVSPPIGSIDASGLYHAPENLPTDTAVAITAKSADNQAAVATTKLALKVLPDPIRVNCGSPSGFTDARGQTWVADYGFSEPSQAYDKNVPIKGASPDFLALYQSSRYRYANEDFYYSFAVPTGKYRVTLKFADYQFADPGHYNFDVAINGARVLKNFDPSAGVGTGQTAVDRSFDVTVTGKGLKIDFRGHEGGAIINGIEIVPLTEPAAERK